MQFPKDLLIFAIPSVPGRRKQDLFSGSTALGSTSVSPYKPLKLRTISRACSSIGSWSSPTGTVVALNAVMSAVCETGYVKKPIGIEPPKFFCFNSAFTVGLRSKRASVTRFI